MIANCPGLGQAIITNYLYIRETGEIAGVSWSRSGKSVGKVRVFRGEQPVLLVLVLVSNQELGTGGPEECSQAKSGEHLPHLEPHLCTVL